MPTISLNGEQRTIPPSSTVEDLVRSLESEGLTADRRAIAVEVNRSIVPRSTYETHTLDDRDEIEIVTIVGGG
ncbi:MAG: sulfur carrier protein ThiS [Planctomycetota bacterium]|jgi:thiamine biosynthesis protein ThiS